MKYKSRFSAIALSLIATAAGANEGRRIELSCPSFIHTRQALAGTPPDGWLPLIAAENSPTAAEASNRHYLSGVQFSSGHPSERAILVPDNPHEFGARKRFIQRWSFTDSQGVYVSCQYGLTTVQLTQAVPSGYKRCEVSFENSRPVTILGVLCRK
jgi:hypothetical protein